MKREEQGRKSVFFLLLSLLCSCLLHANHSCLEKSSRLMMMAIIHCDNGCSVNHVHTLFFVKENWFSQQNSMTTNLRRSRKQLLRYFPSAWPMTIEVRHFQIQRKTFQVESSNITELMGKKHQLRLHFVPQIISQHIVVEKVITVGSECTLIFQTKDQPIMHAKKLMCRDLSHFSWINAKTHL